MGYPTGGEKDTSPPVIISESPKNASINFNGQEIIIKFDEYIKLNNPQQIITSPAIIPNPEYIIKGKSLHILLKNNLIPNTTYSINFGTSISDITENNVNPNIIYAFSTGPEIDTLKISGRILNAYTLQPEKNVKVMLYPTDSAVLQTLPSFLAVTDNNGFFKINYIKKQTYNIAGLKDNNANYIYDLPNEEIAIYNRIIDWQNDSVYNINLYLFKEDKEKQYLSKVTYYEPGKVFIKGNKNFYKPVVALNSGLKSSAADYEFFQYSNDTILLWFNKQIADTLQIIVKDSSFMEFKTIYIDRTNKLNRNKISFIHNGSGNFRAENSFILQSDYPCINKLDELEKIKIYEDTIQVSYAIENINALKWKFIFNKSEAKKYKIIIPANTFTDIYGNTNDTTIIEFKVPDAEYYGLLNLSVNTQTEKPLLLELLTSKGQVIKKISFKKSLKTNIEKLEPGNYNLRIVIDTDKNNMWTNGNFDSKTLPERIIYYNTPVNIRSNWDLDIIWNITESF